MCLCLQLNEKKGKYANYEKAPANAVFFLFDVETTGAKRNWDRIISISVLACDRTGTLLGCFDQDINPEGVKINAYLTNRIHSKCAHI